MLEDYYAHDGYDDEAKHKRLLAVQAALEIAKASASSSPPTYGNMSNDLTAAAEHIGNLADAIQAAISK
ncbi:hypothetical protein ABN357_05755 [Providencia rettgeri]|uniref:hypothetical protein n=1 Tax=Providencia TaxID=586 RepID=UPI001C239CFA|nr:MULTISPECIES: hypothetical protein [Providencia]QXB92536.1 hypothetical protein I6L81_06140 [Providencia rettgeri]